MQKAGRKRVSTKRKRKNRKTFLKLENCFVSSLQQSRSSLDTSGKQCTNLIQEQIKLHLDVSIAAIPIEPSQKFVHHVFANFRPSRGLYEEVDHECGTE